MYETDRLMISFLHCLPELPGYRMWFRSRSRVLYLAFLSLVTTIASAIRIQVTG